MLWSITVVHTDIKTMGNGSDDTSDHAVCRGQVWHYIRLVHLTAGDRRTAQVWMINEAMQLNCDWFAESDSHDLNSSTLPVNGSQRYSWRFVRCAIKTVSEDIPTLHSRVMESCRIIIITIQVLQSIGKDSCFSRMNPTRFRPDYKASVFVASREVYSLEQEGTAFPATTHF